METKILHFLMQNRITKRKSVSLFKIYFLSFQNGADFGFDSE